MQSALLLAIVITWLTIVKGQCSIDPEDRTDCFLGDQVTCESAGCCWSPTAPGGLPWCFYPSSGASHRTTYVHLFEWSWSDIALECEEFLGPNNFTGVQVSPPQEHRILYANGERPWWERYQPVSYQLESRSGTREQFIDMVQRCNAAGVEIYVDAVINHMTGVVTNTEYGTAGSSFGYYQYPIYSWNDFHHNSDYPGQPNCQINSGDYANDAWRVRHCDLSGLVDLDTGSTYVQTTIGNYLADMVSIGVKGFRIDAAKHMEPSDLEGILKRVPDAFIYQEVIDLGNEAVKYEDYLYLGSLAEFLYGARLSDMFRYYSLSSLYNFGEAWGFMPSAKAQSFIENHDNERGHGAGGNVLTYKDGQLYNLANIFMLGWPYGYAQVMSSYVIRNTDHGPPSSPVWQNGRNTCFDSGSQWVCQHRWENIVSMVKFRSVTHGEPVVNWWSNSNNQIAFGRGSKGFVAINKETFAMNVRLQTSMPPGTYCDIIASTNSTCVSVTVDASSYVQVNIQSWGAFAIHV